jgi:hypothetical protein
LNDCIFTFSVFPDYNICITTKHLAIMLMDKQSETLKYKQFYCALFANGFGKKILLSLVWNFFSEAFIVLWQDRFTQPERRAVFNLSLSAFFMSFIFLSILFFLILSSFSFYNWIPKDWFFIDFYYEIRLRNFLTLII